MTMLKVTQMIMLTHMMTQMITQMIMLTHMMTQMIILLTHLVFLCTNSSCSSTSCCSNFQVETMEEISLIEEYD